MKSIKFTNQIWSPMYRTCRQWGTAANTSGRELRSTRAGKQAGDEQAGTRRHRHRVPTSPHSQRGQQPKPHTHLRAAAHVQHLMQVQVVAALEHSCALARLMPHMRGRGGALHTRDCRPQAAR